MRSYGKALAALAIAVLVCSARAQAVLPDWMVQAKNQILPTYEPDTTGVVLLDDTTYVVTSPSEYVEHYRKVVKILRPEGREAGDLVVHFSGHEKVLSLHAWSVDKDGREYEVKDKDFVERGVAGYELYDDVKFRTARAPAANPGSVIGFEYEVRRQPMINQLDDWLQADMPMHEARLTWNYRPVGNTRRPGRGLPPWNRFTLRQRVQNGRRATCRGFNMRRCVRRLALWSLASTSPTSVLGSRSRPMQHGMGLGAGTSD